MTFSVTSHAVVPTRYGCSSASLFTCSSCSPSAAAFLVESITLCMRFCYRFILDSLEHIASFLSCFLYLCLSCACGLQYASSLPVDLIILLFSRFLWTISFALWFSPFSKFMFVLFEQMSAFSYLISYFSRYVLSI